MSPSDTDCSQIVEEEWRRGGGGGGEGRYFLKHYGVGSARDFIFYQTVCPPVRRINTLTPRDAMLESKRRHRSGRESFKASLSYPGEGWLVHAHQIKPNINYAGYRGAREQSNDPLWRRRQIAKPLHRALRSGETNGSTVALMVSALPRLFFKNQKKFKKDQQSGTLLTTHTKYSQWKCPKNIRIKSKSDRQKGIFL